MDIHFEIYYTIFLKNTHTQKKKSFICSDQQQTVEKLWFLWLQFSVIYVNQSPSTGLSGVLKCESRRSLMFMNVHLQALSLQS